ncbi:MAG: prepilin-type N-terminal cleavage/methylation domain-containing protein [Elusimicrobiaceae bacterium]|nr:prepilin-type N-terminal cleavage/methylation domain-containing protein [Elusimicrobiaceae bacterium]
MENEKELLLNVLSFPKVVVGNLKRLVVGKEEVPNYKSQGRHHFIKAFTLTELLIVVLIIGLLTAIAMPMYEKASRKAEFVQVQMDLKYLMDTIDAYTMENGYIRTTSFEGVIDRPEWSCSYSTNAGGYYYCNNKYGNYGIMTGSYYRIVWAPSSSKFVLKGRNLYVFAKYIGQPWKWQQESPYGDGASGFPAQTDTTQMVCDWWVKTGGRPTDSNIAALCS